MSQMVGSIDTLRYCLSSLLDQSRSMGDSQSFGNGKLEPPSGFDKTFGRLKGWYKKFGRRLKGDAKSKQRLDYLVKSGSENPAFIRQHHIAICVQDLMVNSLFLDQESPEEDGPVGGEGSGLWRHGGLVVSGLGLGKAFKIFYEAHLSGIGTRINCAKFDMDRQVAVRGVTKIIEKIEADSKQKFDWQIQEVRPHHVLVVPRKPSRQDRGLRKNSIGRDAGSKKPG